MIMRKVEAKRHSSNNLVRRQGLREIKQSFLIVCEGECTEPDYFEGTRYSEEFAVFLKVLHPRGGNKIQRTQTPHLSTFC